MCSDARAKVLGNGALEAQSVAREVVEQVALLARRGEVEHKVTHGCLRREQVLEEGREVPCGDTLH